MPIVKIDTLGQHGHLPDVQASALPTNGFSYSRNWIFDTGGFARTSPGYHDAFVNSQVDLGDENTEATFMYTWLLSNENAVVYYDRTDDRLKLIETYVVNTTIGTAYTAGDPTLTLADASLFPNVGRGYVELSTGERDLFRWSSKAGNVLTLDTTTVPDENLANNLASGLTVHDLTEIVSQETLSTTAHNNGSEHRWQATDAFGLPIFNNTLEAPWAYIDETPAVVRNLPNWPSGATCNFLQKTSSFLVAIGYQNEGAVVGERGGLRTVAISDVIQTAGTFPTWGFNFGATTTKDYQGYQADGTIGAVTEGAGSFSQLFDLSIYTDGDLVSAFEQNGTLYVNTTTDVVAFRYLGSGTWDASILPFRGGALTSRTVAPIPNGFFHIGNNRMFIHDGSSDTTVGDGKFTNHWFDRVDFERLNEVQVLYDPRNESVKIKTPITANEQEIWNYNLINGTLSIQDDHQEVAFMVFSADGVPGRQFSWDDFGSNAQWDEINEAAWNDFPVEGLGDFRNRILSVGNRKLFVHDSGEQYNLRDIISVLRREDLLFQETPYSRIQVRRNILYISGNSQNVSFRLGGSDNSNSELNWQPYKMFDIDNTLKLDWRFSTHWLAYELRVQGGEVKLSAIELEGSENGTR